MGRTSIDSKDFEQIKQTPSLAPTEIGVSGNEPRLAVIQYIS